MKPTDNLKDLLKDLETPMQEKEIKVEDPLGFQAALNKIILRFGEELRNNSKVKTHNYLQKLVNEFSGLGITKTTVYAFLSYFPAYAQKNIPENIISYTTSVFLTALVQVAYNRGDNNFVLDLPEAFVNNNKPPITFIEQGSTYILRTMRTSPKLDDLCHWLAGKPERKLAATIYGDVGTSFGAHTEHCSLKLYGPSEFNCGFGAKHSDIYVEGNTGNNFGVFAEHSNLEIVGNVGGGCFDSMKDSVAKIKGNCDGCGDSAERSTITVDGDVTLRVGASAKDCTFILLGDIGTDPRRNETPIYGQVYVIQDQQGMGAERTVFRARKQATLDKLLANKAACEYQLTEAA